MSNNSIIKCITRSLADFKAGEINVEQLKNSIEINGRSLEMMPYQMIKELDDIEYKLTLSQLSDDDDFYPGIDEVVEFIEAWLNKVPVEKSR